MLKDKIILTDYDGVVASWLPGFEKYIAHLGYKLVDDSHWDLGDKFGIDRLEVDKLAHEFCDSCFIEDLEPLDNAVEYMTKLHEEFGYKFHIVTSLSAKQEAYDYRLTNFLKYFPSSMLHKLTCLALHERKLDYLRENYYNSGCWWIEDKYENYQDGVDVGLRGILISYPYNEKHHHNNPKLANTWQDVYDIIVKEKCLLTV